MHKSLYILILLAFFFSAARAQEKKYVYKDTTLLRDEEKTEAPKPDNIIEQAPAGTTETEHDAGKSIDTSLYLNNISLSADSIRQWKDLDEFAYAKYLDSLLKEKQKKIKKASTPQTYRSGTLDKILSSSFVRIFFWSLAIVFILFVLYRLFLTQGAFRRETKSIKKETAETEEEEITSGTDFDRLVNQAVQSGNYRQAVRYQYLRTLHKLSGKNLLQLAKDKTNFQYVSELTDAGLRNDFASLTLHYEYVWYGEFNIDGLIYHKIENGFSALNQKI